LNHIFDQTVGNPRAITELINRYRKNFGHANNKGNSALGRIARNRHDLDRNCFTWFAHFAALLSREMDEPADRLNGYDFAVFIRPMMASFRKKFV
jgi:hypothetical protein